METQHFVQRRYPLANDHIAIAGTSPFLIGNTSAHSGAPIFQPAMLVDPGVYIDSFLVGIFQPVVCLVFATTNPPLTERSDEVMFTEILQGCINQGFKYTCVFNYIYIYSFECKYKFTYLNETYDELGCKLQ